MKFLPCSLKSPNIDNIQIWSHFGHVRRPIANISTNVKIDNLLWFLRQDHGTCTKYDNIWTSSILWVFCDRTANMGICPKWDKLWTSIFCDFCDRTTDISNISSNLKIDHLLWFLRQGRGYVQNFIKFENWPFVVSFASGLRICPKFHQIWKCDHLLWFLHQGRGYVQNFIKFENLTICCEFCVRVADMSKISSNLKMDHFWVI